MLEWLSTASSLMLGTSASCLVLSTTALAQETKALADTKPTPTAAPASDGVEGPLAGTAGAAAEDAPPANPAAPSSSDSAAQSVAERTEAGETTASDASMAEVDAPFDAAPSTGEGDSAGGLFESGLSADESSSEGDAPAPTFEVDGYIRSDVFIGKVPDYATAVMKAGYGELALRVRASGGDNGDAFAEMRARYGQQGPRNGLITDLREAYVNAYLGPLDLRFGHQIIVWGRADGFNPTNNLTPIDLRVRSPVEDDRRVGNLAARAFFNFEPFQVEGAWVPLYRPVELPDVAFPEYVELGEPDYPTPEWPRATSAARLHLLTSAFEMSVSYLRGYALMPGLAFQDYSVGDATVVHVSRTAYRQQVVGVDFSTAVGDALGVRGEAAYRRPHEPEVLHAPDPDLQYVLGLDRAFGPVSVIGQYVGRYVLDWKLAAPDEDGPGPEFLTNLDEPVPEETVELIAAAIDTELAYRNQTIFQQTKQLQHMASLRLELLTLHDTLTITALGLYNFNTKELVAYPRVGYQFSDRMSGSVGAELYMGPDDTLMGLIDEQLSAGYAELRYTF